MRVWQKFFIALLTALAVLATGTSVATAQDDPKGPESDDAGSLGPAIASSVIPGVETHGNGNTYVLRDSADAGGPTFNSPVYNPTTVATSASTSDDNGDLVNIGFAFEFYGVPHAQVWVNSNGVLSFGAKVATFSNVDLATATVPVPAIFPYWDDLFPGANGEIRYDTFGSPGQRVFVVKYDDVFLNGAETSGGTFEVRLFETTNVIEVHYSDMVWGNAGRDFGASATIGVRAGAAGTAYLQYSHDLPQINNSLALRMWPATCRSLTPTIVGDRGPDVLTGTGADDVIYGHDGDDTITGNNGTDTLCGGDGNDTMTGGTGIDYMYGDGGNDTMTAGLGIDRMYGGSGNDTMVGDGGSDRMYGQSGDDDMSGLSGADRMFGGSGNDVMNGQGGQDSMWGGAGNDTMQGNHQSDKMYGGTGNDQMFGAGGKDRLYGEGGNDELFGGDNTDYLHGGVGTDLANGQRGKDNPLVVDVSGCVAETKVSC